MSMKIGGFACKLDREATWDALRRVAQHAPEEAMPANWLVGVGGDWTSVGIPSWELGHAASWAQAVSQIVPAVTVSVFVLEGTWNVSVFHHGANVAARLEFDLAAPTLLGDIDRAAELLGVQSDLLRAYNVGDPFGDLDAGRATDAELEALDEAEAQLDGFRVRAADGFPPWDEYGYLDLFRHMGIPDVSDGQSAVLECGTREPAPWSLPGVLSEEHDVAHVFDPRPFREAHLLAPPPGGAGFSRKLPPTRGSLLALFRSVLRRGR